MLVKILKNKKGMALLITLAVTTLIVTAAIELNRKVRATVVTTATIRDQLTLSHIASSGIHAAMAMLVKDRMADPPNGFDSVQEDWANPEKIAEVLQDIPFEEGRVTFKISDEMGKIQVNSLVKYPEGKEYNQIQYALWDNFLRPIVSKDESVDMINATTAIIDTVKDWLDFDDDVITGLHGAESDYYQSLDPPYECKNGPFAHIDEIFMVKGVKPEFFQGIEGLSSTIEGMPENDEKKNIPDISGFMTVYGMTKAKTKVNKKDFTYEGKININTAPLPVLMALVGPDNPEYAQAIYEYRQEKDDTNFVNSLTSPTWYKNALGIPDDFAIKPELLTYSSDIFRIEATATLHDMKLTVTTVVQREKDKKTKKWRCKVLSWEPL